MKTKHLGIVIGILLIGVFASGCTGGGNTVESKDGTMQGETPAGFGYPELENSNYRTYSDESVTFEYPDYWGEMNFEGSTRPPDYVIKEKVFTLSTTPISGELSTPTAYISNRESGANRDENEEILDKKVSANEGYIKTKDLNTHREYDFYSYEFTKIIMCNGDPFKLYMRWEGNDLIFPTHIIETFKCV